jgi:DNA repair exonuclease SbcCD ATPase subunit
MFLSQVNDKVTLTDVAVLPHLKSLLKDLKSQKKDVFGSQEFNESSQKHVENCFKKVYQSSLLYEKRIQQLKEEKEALDHTMDCIWNNLENLIGPLWKLEEGMFGIYEQVARVYKDLLLLKNSPKLNTRQVAEIQDKLNDIENQFKIDGKFLKEGDKEVQGGQAVIIALIERCYRLAHHLILEAPEVDPALVDYKLRVEKIISDLNLINTAPSAGLKIYKDELMQIQKELDEIDSNQHESKFLDSYGNIPAGQAHLRDLIERAYDLVNDCMLKIENQEEEDHSFLKVMKDSIRQMEDRLLESTTSVFALSRAKVSELNDQLSNTVGYVKEWLNSPKQGLNKISSKVASVHRSGMSVLSKIYAELEPVDDELLPVKTQLNTIRSSLLDLRNQFNRNDMAKTSEKAELKDLKDKVESVHSELEALDRNRVDGNFVTGSTAQFKTGQDHLRSLMNECYCLVFELIDRCSVVDF